MPNLYLLINFFSILFPLAYSFDKRVRYFKRWKYLFPALLIPAILFIAWDMYFTSIGVWGFNPRYLSGINIINLPLEEVLFFFCIPFASIFIYDVVKYFDKGFSVKVSSGISLAIILLSLVAAVIYREQIYPLVTFISVGVFVFIMQFILKAEFIGRFYLSYLFILIPFLIVNGLLTGSFIHEEVVWYNSAEIMGIRINTIPVEDAFYGLLLLMMNVALYEGFMKKAKLT